MSILSSLVVGNALHAHGDASVTYQAIMATLTQVLRIVQVLVVVGLFYGVFRLWWAFIKRATTLPCSHGFADSTECLDCSHPDWFNEVERYRSELSPVVEPEYISPSRCEDFPCCGHTDGLGCNWVSPNEVQPCQVCIDARKSYPYHDGHSCPTAREQAEAQAQVFVVPDGVGCEGCGDEPTHKIDDTYLCQSCWYDWQHELEAYNASMQEQYDDEWRRW